MGHSKLFVASGLQRRVSRPHHIGDTKLPDGATELLRLAGGMAGAPLVPAGDRPDRDQRGAADLPDRRVAGVGEESRKEVRGSGGRCGVPGWRRNNL
jgi:hypothetical protein